MAAECPFDLGDARTLLDDRVAADPSALYDQLRRDAPVWQVPGQATFLVADPDLIKEAVARTGELSSNFVSVLHRGADGCPVPFDLLPLGHPMHVLATADPPAHSRHRKLLQPHLSPAAVAAHEPAIAALTDELLDDLLGSDADDRTPRDVVAGLTDPLPVLTICHVTGVPRAEAPEIIRLVSDTGLMLDGVSDAEAMGIGALAAIALGALAERHVHEALAGDRPAGLLGVLADGVDAGTIERAEARDILVQLLSAGTETTASHLATAIERIADRAELQEELRADPSRIPAALDDALREDGPFQLHYRWSTTDLVLGGVEIPAGSRVQLLWAAANRPAPDATEPVDPTAPHLAFGRGLHFCIGAPLARLEVRVAVERLLARTAWIELDPDDPPQQRPSTFLRRHARLPIVIDRRGAAR